MALVHDVQVADGRGMSVKAVRALAGGRVFTGQMAVQVGGVIPNKTGGKEWMAACSEGLNIESAWRIGATR